MEERYRNWALLQKHGFQYHSRPEAFYFLAGIFIKAAVLAVARIS